MTSRRNFLKTGVAVGGAGLVAGGCASGLSKKPGYFGLHPFIEKHPEAVFIKRTNIPSKLDSKAKKQAGLSFAEDVFVLKDKGGIPLSHKIVIKPNLTCGVKKGIPLEDGMGIITDPYFIEGIIMGMKKNLGTGKFHIIECNCSGDWPVRGYTQMAKRTGAILKPPTPQVQKAPPGELNYIDVPDGVLFKRFAYIAPTNGPNTWLMNIAKWKAHGMGLTQCCKNLQGLAAPTYVGFCNGLGGIKNYPSFIKKDILPGYVERITASYERHVKEGYPRWDLKGVSVDAPRMETWSQRTLDNMLATPTGFSIIEGLYGREGDGFHRGKDYLTNTLIFGMDNFRNDIIGLWLACHEPGNFGFYHIAVERGLSDTINPWEIPVYEFVDGNPVPRKLTDFERHPLKTYYIRRESEEEFHLVNESFDYDKWARKHKRVI